MCRKNVVSLTVALAASLVFCGLAGAADVTLKWQTSCAKPTGCRIYYGEASGRYTHVIEVGNVTSRKITGLKSGVSYYFLVKAYNCAGESVNVDEVVWSSTSKAYVQRARLPITVNLTGAGKPPAPTGLKLGIAQ
jgi:hypothetical protein